MSHGGIPNFRGHILTVAVVSAIGLGFLLLSVAIGGGLPSGSTPYKVKALLPSSASLARNARVTMGGVHVGRVASVERRGVGAIVEVEITDDRVTPIPSDSAAQLRMRTPVGENYLAIEPGRSTTKLSSDSVLPMSQPDDYVDVDQVLSILDGEARVGARRLIQGIARGVENRGGELNEVVEGGAGFLRDGSTLVNVLAKDRRQVSRLIENLGNVAAAIGERDGSIQSLARGGLTTFETIAERDDALRRLLRVLPSTLSQVRATTGTLRSVSTTATPVLTDVSHALREVRPAVRTLRPAAQEGRGVVSELGRAAPPLQRTLSRVRALSKPAPGAFRSLKQVICQVAPVVRYAAPYTDDVVALISGLGSAANSYDATGHLLRLIPIIDENTLVGLPAGVSKSAHLLLRSGLLGKSVAIDYDPFPKPGQIGKTVADRENPTLGPDEVPKSGYKYPRITADC